MKDKITAIIDADSMIWVIAYNHREDTNSLKMINSLDKYITETLNGMNATHYAGFIGGDKCFRYDVAKYRPYKGLRPEKPEWIKKWEGILRHHMTQVWKFVVCDGIEADDAVSICMHQLPLTDNPILGHIDKDLDQVPGNHFNYQKKTFYRITEDQARHKRWVQVLTGDTTDNIVGVPGIGEVKAETIVKGAKTEEMYEKLVRGAFHKYFGEYYGDIIMKENVTLISTLTDFCPMFLGVTLHEVPKKTELITEDIVNVDLTIFD